jgi:preprotein translocase subunit SecB
MTNKSEKKQAPKQLTLKSLITKKMFSEVNPFIPNEVETAISSGMKLVDIQYNSENRSECYAFLSAELQILPQDKKDSEEINDRVATIYAFFMLTFLSESPINDTDSVVGFIKNASLGFVWPYWREIVSTQTIRMGISAITLPVEPIIIPAPAGGSS